MLEKTKHRRQLSTSLLLVLMICLTACQEPSPSTPPQLDTPSMALAQVGQQVITQEDVDAEIRQLPESVREHINRSAYQKSILQTLIRRAVLSQQASEIGLDHNPDIHRRIQRSRDSIMIEALTEWKLKNIPEPKASDIQAYYQQHRSDFSIPEQIHARHILVRDKKLAQKIYRQLSRHKDTFSNLAVRYSMDDSNKARGGDLNWFPRGTMIPAFEQVAFALKNPGDISLPVKTKFGWHIIELLERHPASQAKLDDVRDEIIQILRQQQLEAWIQQRVQDAHPVILTPST